MSRDVRLRFDPPRPPRSGGDPRRAEPLRLDRFLAEKFPQNSRAAFARLIESGAVRVDGRAARKGQILHGGEEIAFSMPDPRAIWRIVAEPDAALHVWHEDGAIVCVEKPPCVPCLPLRPDEQGTVAGALVARYPELQSIGGPLEAGLLHRLDTGTSGLLVAARTADAYERLRADWREGRVRKIYLAIVVGSIEKAGRIEAPLAHHPKSERRMIVVPDPEAPGALPAHSEYEPIRTVAGAAGGARTLLRIRIHEGRRHQIRIHLASIGHPVIGDDLYGPRRADAKTPALPESDAPSGGLRLSAGRLALHAHALGLTHPETRAPLALESPLPADLSALLEETRD